MTESKKNIPAPGVILTDTKKSSWSGFGQEDFNLFDSAVPIERRRARLPLTLTYIDYLGKAMLVCLFLIIVTGIFLSARFQPTESAVIVSIDRIQNESAYGWWLRGVHRYATDLFIVLALIRLGRMGIRRAYKFDRSRTWVASIIILLFVVAGGLTAYLGFIRGLFFEDVPIPNFVRSTYLTHIAVGLIVVLYTIYWRLFHRRKAPEFRDIDHSIPPAITLSVLTFLTFAALIFPPVTGMIERGLLSSGVPDVPWPIINFIHNSNMYYPYAGMILATLGVAILMSLPWTDRYTIRGPKAEISAFLTIYLATLILFSLGGLIRYSLVWAIYIAIGLTWFGALIFTAVTGKEKSKPTEIDEGGESV